MQQQQQQFCSPAATVDSPTVVRNQLDLCEREGLIVGLIQLCASPGSDMDVLQQAGKTICQGHAQRCQQVVPVRLHVLTGPALGIALAACVLVVRGYDVGDEVVVTAGGLAGGGGYMRLDDSGLQKTIMEGGIMSRIIH